MGVRVTDIRISDEFRAGENEPFLLGVIGEKVRFELDIEVEECFFSSAEAEVDQIILNPNVTLTQTAFNDDIIYCEDVSSFVNMSLGDTISVSGSLASDGNYIISEVLDDNIIRVKTTGGGAVTFPNADEVLAPTGLIDAAICVVTPFQGITYFYNMIENQAATTYTSLIDGETQRFSTNNADATDPSLTPMNYEGIKSYQVNASCFVKGRGIVDGIQKFTIIHNTFITPLFLQAQYNDLLSRTAPDYFLGGNCLRYVTTIDAGRSLTDPNTIQTIEFSELQGNTGWFNENFNGGINYYSIDSYSLERVSDSTALTALELTEQVEATITIKNTTNSPFVNGDTFVVSNFCYLPNDEAYYQNNGNTFRENFFFDRVGNVLGSGFVNGDNFTSDQQMLLGAEATFVSASEIEVKITFDAATAAQAIISARDVGRYMMWITTEDYNLNKANSDKVALLVDVNDFFIQLTDINLVTSNSVFIQHPFEDVADGEATVSAFPVDDIVARSDFNIDFTNYLNDGIKINAITNQIVVANGVNPDIILEDTTISTSASPLLNGLVPIINVNQDRIFKIPAGEIRKVIDIQRNSSLDSGDTYHWYCNYPFMHRWEYWENQPIPSFLPVGIYDTNEPNNGLNEQWHRYTTVAGWSVYHRLKFTIEQNGEIFQQIFDNAYTSNDFNSNAEWGNESIISYDVVTGNPIVNGGTKLIQGYTDTKIVATFEKIAGDIPLIDEVEVVIWIETKEKGGISDIRRISSVYPTGANTWFKSTDTSNKVVKNKTGSVYTGECLIDSSKLPADNNYTVYARLYDLTAGIPVGAKLMEDGSVKLMEDNTIKIIE